MVTEEAALCTKAQGSIDYLRPQAGVILSKIRVIFSLARNGCYLFLLKRILRDKFEKLVSSVKWMFCTTTFASVKTPFGPKQRKAKPNWLVQKAAFWFPQSDHGKGTGQAGLRNQRLGCFQTSNRAFLLPAKCSLPSPGPKSATRKTRARKIPDGSFRELWICILYVSKQKEKRTLPRELQIEKNPTERTLMGSF